MGLGRLSGGTSAVLPGFYQKHGAGLSGHHGLRLRHLCFRRLPAVWAKDLAAPADYAKTVRAITTAYTAGMLVMGPIPGILADRFGSYIPAYLFFALCQLVLTLIIQGIYFKLDLGKRPEKV